MSELNKSCHDRTSLNCNLILISVPEELKRSQKEAGPFWNFLSDIGTIT